MTLLSQADYLATMGQTREPLQPENAAVVNIGGYVRSINEDQFAGFDFSAWEVANAWSMDDGAWQHVLFGATTPNVFLVVVLNGLANEVHGHHVLDLNRAYGIDV